MTAGLMTNDAFGVNAPAATSLRVLVITSEWPNDKNPNRGVFIARQVDFLRRSGVETEVFAFQGAKSFKNYLLAYRQLRSLVRTRRYDILHAQFGQSGALAALLMRPPLVVTFRGSDVHGIYGSRGRYTASSLFLRAMSRFAAVRADETVVVSKSLIPLLPSRYYHVLPSGIDLDLFKPSSKEDARTQLGLPQSGKLVLFGGGKTTPVKRYKLASETVAIVEKNMPVEMVILNQVPHQKMPLYMNACDVLLLTSAHEGSPNVVKEALACNLPVVSVKVGDVEERLKDVANCRVCNGDTPDELAAALLEVLDAPRSEKARNAVLSLCEKKITGELINIYRSALGKQVI
jgi:teichuronic acid biosynthesis glycosyltransferase TuaC